MSTTPDQLDLLQGTLDLLVLRALSWAPMHGYGVARRRALRDETTHWNTYVAAVARVMRTRPQET